MGGTQAMSRIDPIPVTVITEPGRLLVLDAETALRYGIVSRVLAPDELMPSAIALAQRIAKHPPLAVRFAKRAINRGMQTDLDSGLEYERYAAAMIIDSNDRKEGMRAFVEKRKPVFTGR